MQSIGGNLKLNYVKEGASRYITGQIEQFNQKNEMFKRPLWDLDMLNLGKRFYKDKALPRKTPGYTLPDQAMVNASWRLDTLCNNGPGGESSNLYARSWNHKFSFPRVPSGLKITVDDPLKITAGVKKAAGIFGASLVGVCELDRRWLYSSAYYITSDGGKESENYIPKEFKYAVVIAIEMDYENIRYSPSHPASVATGLGYSKMAFTAGLLAQYIRGLGFKAIPAGNSTACSIPIAIDAGLGEMGRNGLLVTPDFGPRIRLAKVLTNLPLVPDSPIEFGVQDFCKICGKCSQKCPSRAIDGGEPTAEPHNISNRKGVEIWHINAEKCLTFWADNRTDCANCIRVCPFNKLPGLFHNFVRWGIKDMPMLNRLFLWGDDMMGYGKRKNAKHFF
jgi:epoxyqueuosine reductase